jgi:hypothetical protein
VLGLMPAPPREWVFVVVCTVRLVASSVRHLMHGGRKTVCRLAGNRLPGCAHDATCTAAMQPVADAVLLRAHLSQLS